MSELIGATQLQALKPLNLFGDSKNIGMNGVDGEGNAFGTIFQSYLDLFNETNTAQLSAEQLQLDYAAGKTDDMVSVMLAQEKAYTSLNFTVQVTNKIIEAYREIMRIQL